MFEVGDLVSYENSTGCGLIVDKREIHFDPDTYSSYVCYKVLWEGNLMKDHYVTFIGETSRICELKKL